MSREESTFPSELEERIRYLEDPANQGKRFTGLDWLLLLVTGIVGPVLLLIWGWPL